MQIAQEDATASAALDVALPESSTGGRSPYSEYKLIRRNGAVVGFEPAKITVAVTKAFLAVNGSQAAASARIRELVASLTEAVVGALMRRQPQGGTFHIEDVQDQVELALMRSGEHDVARAYVLYREERAKLRAQEKAARTNHARVHVVENGQRRPLDRDALQRLVVAACEGVADALPEPILEATLRDLYDGVPMDEVRKSAVLAARALKEKDREQRAIEFYNVLSSFDFMSSTPTLFNAGTQRSQLSSCYLTTVSDDLDGIYEAIKENALLAKYAGGLGNDWTPVRALGSHIKGTNGKSQGVVPFLKVVNDTAVAVNQGGKRKGAVCSYLETWHLDIEEFLELRKNTGDDRRRTHDMNTANWIPDLFMKRVMDNAEWTLFSPSDCRDLHEKYGRAFEEAYLRYEDKVARGELKLFKKVPAVQLWRKMLSMLFETGHPWITFKDPCNLRSPQQHVGVVHSSNLCTEITLNTNCSEIAVCNLGSINMVGHMKLVGETLRLDHDKLKKTVATAMRMLDNVIDINYYAVRKARDSNLKHRPVGLGIMGFQDCLQLLRIPYASQQAVEFADRSMEAIAYFSYWASTELAEERGRYASYKGSLWDRGIMPQDTLNLLREERGGYVDIDMSESMDWKALRERIKRHGMRHSNCLAIAPTATIANIVGVSASIEPTFQNLFVKSNLSGEFTIVNEYLVVDLKKLGLWDEVMVADLKYFDGNLARIDRIPSDLRRLYATAFEVEPVWVVEAGARRQKWIDQSQSLNIYIGQASGRKLDESYKLAWQRGLKTTYYLRSMGATHAEKSTVRAGKLNAVPAGEGLPAAGATAPRASGEPEIKFCKIDDPDCESCQ